MEYPEGCNTAIRYVARKVATIEDRDVTSGWVDLYITLLFSSSLLVL